MDINKMIKMALAYAGISQAEVSRRIGTTKTNVSKKISHGNRIRVLDLASMADAMGAKLNISIDFPDGTSIGDKS